MALLPPIELSGAEKIETLRRLDRYRKWHSLDEKRYCLVCGQIINGREIQVVGGTRGSGPLRVICPTRGCHSIPMDWIIPTDQVLAPTSMLQSKRNCSEQKLRGRGKNFEPGCANSRCSFATLPDRRNLQVQHI
jgi:hypothetical protein